MNAKQIKIQSETKRAANLSLIPLEKAAKPTLWERLKLPFTKSDLSFEQWERLEMKRCRPPTDFNHMGRF
ncbi:MAG: hypothetical protein AB7K41_04780 [Bdellovibrionales bacterium]